MAVNAEPAEKRCIGNQFGPCGEVTINEHGRCRDCDIEYLMELQRCEACGWWCVNDLGRQLFGMAPSSHDNADACPFMAL